LRFIIKFDAIFYYFFFFVLISQSASAQAALQAAQALTVSGGTGATNGTLSTAPAEIQGGPNTVLRVIVEHMIYPIVLDVLHSIFQRYGKVLKIVTFTKNSEYFFHMYFIPICIATSEDAGFKSTKPNCSGGSFKFNRSNYMVLK
jgi:hypothetical protein